MIHESRGHTSTFLVLHHRSRLCFIFLFTNEFRNHAIEIVEEREHVEAKLDPSFALRQVQNLSVHDGGGIVDAEATHDWTCAELVDMVGDQRHVEEECEPFAAEQK